MATGDTGDTGVMLASARDAFTRADWSAAFQEFRAAGESTDLSADDCFALADSAWWIG